MLCVLLLPASPEARHAEAMWAGIRRQTRPPDAVLRWEQNTPPDIPGDALLWILDMNTVPLPDAMEKIQTRYASCPSGLLRMNVHDKERGESSLPSVWKQSQWLEARNVRDEWWTAQSPCGDPLCVWAGRADILLRALREGHDLSLQALALEKGMGLVTERVAVRTPLPGEGRKWLEDDPAGLWKELPQWSRSLAEGDRGPWLRAVRARVRERQLGFFEKEIREARRRYSKACAGPLDRFLCAVMGVLRRLMSHRLAKTFHD